MNLNEDGDTIPMTNQREDPRNIHNIAHSRGEFEKEQRNERDTDLQVSICTLLSRQPVIYLTLTQKQPSTVMTVDKNL